MGKETEAQRSSTDLPKAKHNRVRPTTLILWITVYPFSVKLEKSFIAFDVLLVKKHIIAMDNLHNWAVIPIVLCVLRTVFR